MITRSERIEEPIRTFIMSRPIKNKEIPTIEKLFNGVFLLTFEHEHKHYVLLKMLGVEISDYFHGGSVGELSTDSEGMWETIFGSSSS